MGRRKKELGLDAGFLSGDSPSFRAVQLAPVRATSAGSGDAYEYRVHGFHDLLRFCNAHRLSQDVARTASLLAKRISWAAPFRASLLDAGAVMARRSSIALVAVSR
jgi:hypothetical protein